MLFRIHRMKETAREAFRWAAHTSGLAIAKPMDYEAACDVEAASAYDAWTQLRSGNSPRYTCDILEDESASLMLAKSVGSAPAQWWTPEPQSAPPSTAVGASGMSGNSAAPVH